MRQYAARVNFGKTWQDLARFSNCPSCPPKSFDCSEPWQPRRHQGEGWKPPDPVLTNAVWIWMSREVTQWKKNEKMTFLIHYTRICFKHWDVMMLPLENWTEHVKFAACDNEALTWSGRAWTRHLATVSTHAGFASRWGLSLASSRWLEASSSPGEWVLKKMAISTAPKVPCRWFRPTNSIMLFCDKFLLHNITYN